MPFTVISVPVCCSRRLALPVLSCRDRTLRDREQNFRYRSCTAPPARTLPAAFCPILQFPVRSDSQLHPHPTSLLSPFLLLVLNSYSFSLSSACSSPDDYQGCNPHTPGLKSPSLPLWLWDLYRLCLRAVTQSPSLPQHLAFSSHVSHSPPFLSSDL